MKTTVPLTMTNNNVGGQVQITIPGDPGQKEVMGFVSNPELLPRDQLLQILSKIDDNDPAEISAIRNLAECISYLQKNYPQTFQTQQQEENKMNSQQIPNLSQEQMMQLLQMAQNAQNNPQQQQQILNNANQGTAQDLQNAQLQAKLVCSDPNKNEKDEESFLSVWGPRIGYVAAGMLIFWMGSKVVCRGDASDAADAAAALYELFS